MTWPPLSASKRPKIPYSYVPYSPQNSVTMPINRDNNIFVHLVATTPYLLGINRQYLPVSKSVISGDKIHLLPLIAFTIKPAISAG